jgi:hypothetical protein
VLARLRTVAQRPSGARNEVRESLLPCVPLCRWNPRENQTLRARKVMPPELSNPVLATHVPDSKADIAVLDRFDVESNCWDGCDTFSHLEVPKIRERAKCFKGKIVSVTSKSWRLKVSALGGKESFFFDKRTFNLYSTVVFPAASRPSMRMRYSLVLSKSFVKSVEIERPIIGGYCVY